LVLDQVDGLPRLAAEAHQDVAGHVGVLGEAGQRAVELVVVGAAVLHGAAGLVRDRHHAVHVGVAAQQVGGTELLGDVLAGAGRAVDGADDGDVVARAVAATAAVVTHKGARLGRGRRRRAVAAEGVVALEGGGADVVDVDVAAGRDVLAGKADDLAVLGDRLALPDRPQGELVPQADAPGGGEGGAAVPHPGPRRDGTGGDGDVIFGAEVDGNLGQRHGRHEDLSGAVRGRTFPSRYRGTRRAGREKGATGRACWLVPLAERDLRSGPASRRVS